MTRRDKYLTFFEHAEELRSRIIKSLACLVVASCCVFTASDRILPFLIYPIGQVVFTSPGEAFATYMMLSLVGGVILSAPVLLYQLWQFMAAGLKEEERKYLTVFAPLSLIFFFVGCGFGYFVMLPVMLKFFLSFSSPSIVPMITIGKYISFVGHLVLSCGIVFEMPLAIAFLAKIGIATPYFLMAKRKHAAVAIFIVSAVLTPSPDVFSQILMAVPLLVLYEISILLAKLTYRQAQDKAPEISAAGQ